jgi:hypothetical protein
MSTGKTNNDVLLSTFKNLSPEQQAIFKSLFPAEVVSKLEKKKEQKEDTKYNFDDEVGDFFGNQLKLDKQPKLDRAKSLQKARDAKKAKNTKKPVKKVKPAEEVKAVPTKKQKKNLESLEKARKAKQENEENKKQVWKKRVDLGNQEYVVDYLAYRLDDPNFPKPKSYRKILADDGTVYYQLGGRHSTTT